MDLQYKERPALQTEPPKIKKLRLPELDLLSVLFCFMVLFIHTSSYVISTYDSSTVFYQAVYALWKISMSAIYGFIFVSGMKFILSQKERFSPVRYYRSRIVTVLIPYLVATALYYLVILISEQRAFDWKELLTYIVNGQASAQLYFVIVILFFYLLAPLWKWITAKIPGAITIPLVTAASVFVIVAYPTLTYQDNAIFKALPFWIAGCYLGKAYKRNGAQCYQKLLGLPGILRWSVFLAVTAGYTIYSCITHESGTVRSGLLGVLYAAFFVAFATDFALRVCRKLRLPQKESISRYTYFVFLDHCFFVTLVNLLLPSDGIGYYLLRLLIVPLCSWIVAWLLHNVYAHIIVRGFGIKKLLLFLLNRVVIVSVLILLQLIFLAALIVYFYDYYLYYYTVITVIGLLVCLYIINTEANPSYKIAWITVVLGLHLFGLLLYVVFHDGTRMGFTKRRMLAITEGLGTQLDGGDACLQAIETENRDASVQSSYIARYAACPPYSNSACAYFSSGEEMFERMFLELEKAERYIFLEFFIIKPGRIFDRLSEILMRKAKDGVDVRVLYDDVGCIRHLSAKMLFDLASKGIKIKNFNPYVPVLSALLNNRDHRKIVSIDGMVAFTGGVNVGDEYANVDPPFGHWKDAAIMVQGEAAWSFTVMFLSSWNYLAARKKNDLSDYSSYKPEYEMQSGINGYIQPYTDSPLDFENVSKTVYLNMINRAQKYVYISSPYLALDNELITAICNAAKSGVDIRLILPGIPDKRIVNQVTKSYYEIFTKYGVKIYEYTPGFNHAKIFICDDTFATVGSVNLDFRSLYLSFECGVWLYRSPEIPRMLEDYRSMLQASQEITYEMARRIKLPVRIFRALLRFFSPLM